MGRRGRDGGNKRGRTQRRDFRDGRPNVWKKSRPEPSADQPDAQPSSETGWMPFVMESTSFELFYKVLNSLISRPILLTLLESRSFDESLRFMVYQRADNVGFCHHEVYSRCCASDSIHSYNRVYCVN